MPNGGNALKISTTIENAGGLRVTFPLSSALTVTVYRADSAMWDDAVQHGEVLWSMGQYRQYDLLAIEGIRPPPKTLEPGERMRRFTLVPIPASPCAAYRISMSVEGHPRLMWRTRPAKRWETELVFGWEETDG